MDISNKKGSKVGGLTIFLVILMSVPTLSFAEECPQIRKTQIAPKEFLTMQNPLPLNDKNLKAAEKLFEKTAKPIACKTCHGITGNGVGDPGFESTPPSRNFTCTQTMQQLPDGQLFWIIKNGSKGAAMPAYSYLSDKKIWQLILYIRSLSNLNS